MGDKVKLISLESALREKTPVCGLSDFLSKIPFLAYCQIASTGAVVDNAWLSLKEESKDKRENELVEYVDFRGFGFRWGLHGKNSISTRLAHEAILQHSEKLASLLDEYYKEGKFAKGVLIYDKDLVVAVSLVARDCAGNIAPYWNSYWGNIMTPLLAFAIDIKAKS